VNVVDPTGRSIPEATVSAGSLAASVDAAGVAELEATAPVTVRASAPGFSTVTKWLDDWGDEDVTLVLRPEPVYSTVEVVVRQEPVAPVPAGSPVIETSAIEIEQTGARTVLDAVEQLVPSTSVTRRGVMGYGISAGGTGGVSIRGVGNSPNTGVLVLIDGRPDYMGMMGHPMPDFYSLPDAEAIRVTEGPASVLYGSNAMGGVVDVRPVQPTEGPHTEITGSLGSFYTGQYRVKHGAGFRKWYYQVTAGADHTNGDRPVSHYRNQNGTAAVGYKFSERWSTGLHGRWGHFVVEDPGAVGASPGIWSSVGRGGFSWNLDNTTGRVWGSTRLFGSWGHHHISDGWRSNDRTVGGRIDQSVLITPTVLVDAGAELVDYGGDGRNVSGMDYGHHFGTSVAGFGRVHWTPSTRFRFHVGLRRENNSIFGAITVPEAGASIGLSSSLSLDLSTSKGFRNPTIRELYLFPAPNPDLQPEHMWSYQASLRFQPNRRLTASIGTYYSDLDNMVIVTGRYPNLELTNGGRALNRGLDTRATYQVTSRLKLHGGYAYLRSTNLAPYVPAHKGTYRMELDLSKVSIYVGGVTVGSRWANSAKTAELDGYTVPTLKLVIPVGRYWTFFGTVDNLFNEDYEVVTGYPMPGTNANGGFTVRF